MAASRIDRAYTPMKKSIETEKIIMKTPRPMVMCLTLFAIVGKVDKDRFDWSLAAEKPVTTCFSLRQ